VVPEDRLSRGGNEWSYAWMCSFVLTWGNDLLYYNVQVGEKAILKCRSDYAYGKSGTGSIPADATLLFDVELLGFHKKKKQKWEMTPEENLEEALKLKDEGTEAFKAQKFDEAAAKYVDAISHVEAIRCVLCSEHNPHLSLSSTRYAMVHESTQPRVGICGEQGG
jgi:hypothetical protein